MNTVSLAVDGAKLVFFNATAAVFLSFFCQKHSFLTLCIVCPIQCQTGCFQFVENRCAKLANRYTASSAIDKKS